MKIKNVIAAAAVLVALFTACTSDSAHNQDTKQKVLQEVAKPDSTFTPLYAENFKIEYYPTYKKIITYNPWDGGKVMDTYYLVRESGMVTEGGEKCITIPVSNVAATSCCHVAFINNIGAAESIKGVCNPELIYCQKVRDAVSSGKCADLGDSFNIEFEPTILLNPDVIFTTAFNQTNTAEVKLTENGAPVVRTLEWTEKHILGRAEWIVFMAAFFDKEAEARYIYDFEVLNDYNELLKVASWSESKPSVMSGAPFKGTWSMPAGNSYMNILFTDAGATYFFSDDTRDGSLPLSLEYVLKNFLNTDVWIGLDVDTYAELQQIDSRLTQFTPFKEHRAYNQNKRKLPGGANDFWENGVVHPEWILNDIIYVLHGTVDSTYFFKPLE